ncbi:MAG: BlaI/MecI/CopY family transcriptional regulator [Bacteroidales bacterium]|nr:BlaI/MecI/CopY family transcriptional regulator [Bacteroidales bacterium]
MNSKKHRPTESELEILQILWEKGPATVREVHEIIESNRDIGYTTTLKIMQIMTDKGLLQRDTSQRSHLYNPAFKREDIEGDMLNKMIQNLFSGSASRMVIGALSQKSLTEKEIGEIRDYLNQLQVPEP